MEEFKEKWQQELDLFKNFKTAFILEGEIYDKQPYIDEDNEFTVYPLDEYLYRKLSKMGYSDIVYFNHVDGFYSSFDEQSVKNFAKVVKKVEKGENDKEKICLTPEGHDAGSKFGNATELIRKAMTNEIEPIAIVMNLASRYITSSSHLGEQEQYFYSELLLATQNFSNPFSKKTNQRLNNIIILVVDKVNDVPTWFYLNNPNVKTLMLTLPDNKLREYFLNASFDLFYDIENIKKEDEKEIAKIKNKFIDLTEGLRNVDLEFLRDLMNTEKISLREIEKGITLYKHGIKENPWSDPKLINEKLDTLKESLESRVKGQDTCLKQISDIVTRAVYGLSGITHSSSSQKPKGIMFFAGPTGTGKTETAKALAEWLFGTEDACIRFDMSEYSQSHSDQKLLGAPPGYVGYEEGGQLTNAVKKRPFSILLFDEIEKADRTILDKFLQILEDGRMTDGKGETVYFSDTIIIFTSNLGINKTNYLTNEKVERISYDGEKIFDPITNKEIENYDDYKQKIMEGIDEYFINQAGRPEIKNRIGENFIVFEFISKEVARLIADFQINKIIKNIKNQKNIVLDLEDKAKENIYSFVYKNLKQGGRGVGNAIEKYLINPLARTLAKEKVLSNATFIIKEILVEKSIVNFDYEVTR